MKYPFSQHEADHLKAASERPYADVNLDNLNDLSAADMFIHADTLRAQAQVARDAGFPHLAENLLRAAELTAVPNEEVLKIYDALRPERSSAEDLLRIAQWLETQYHAVENARFIREAAEVYRVRGLLRRES
jgi:propanediol dehydratase small subunit